MATRFHPMTDEGKFAVAWDGDFVGFVQEEGACWHAFTVENEPIGRECQTRMEAATACHHAHRGPRVKLARLMKEIRDEEKRSRKGSPQDAS